MGCSVSTASTWVRRLQGQHSPTKTVTRPVASGQVGFTMNGGEIR